MSYTTNLSDDEELKRLAYIRSAKPREYFAELRAKGALENFPVSGGGNLALLRRADVEYALKHWEDFSSDFAGIMGSPEPIIPLNVDPPLHVKYRKLLDPYFAPKKMKELQPAVEKHVNDIIDTVIDKGGCDFSTDMAVPMPCSTFLSLFGLPLEELHDLVYWKDVMIRPEHMVGPGEDPMALQQKVVGEVYGRFAVEIAERRARPREDLISHLVHADTDDGKLTDSELLRICFLMLSAGLDTVTVSLECIFAYLCEHPEARQMLATQPGSEVNLIEELLRWETPVQGVSRQAKRDITLSDGTVVPAGTLIGIGIASANVDPDGLPGADQVDVTRGDVRNFAFGGGPHRCLGSNLARMELRTVVRTWHDRIPEYRAAGEFIWNSSSLRGIDHMPLAW
ncbi:MAG: cytochrome P450 [Acidimicrobiia bacterium]